ncbi:putative defense protein 3 [Saccostrea cucullata]|uniref:putative defense protein 3 n=1 Tax=Saccostrea cuccullata TaxID=36930 RepID=UPI002ED42140
MAGKYQCHLQSHPRGIKMCSSMRMQSVVVCLSFCVAVVYGYSAGAPAGVCESMVPGHGAAIQAGPSPYRVTMNTTSYTAGDRIMVTVSGGTFRGLLVEVRLADCSTVTYPTFSLMTSESNLQTLACNGEADSAVTHTNRNDKTEANFYWTPSSSLGHVYFRATVVQVQNTYWVGIESPVLRDNNSTDLVPDPICPITTSTATTSSTTMGMNGTTTNQVGGGGGNNAGADLRSTVASLIIMMMASFLTI